MGLTITNQLYMVARAVNRTYPTDTYYVPLANNILKALERKYLGKIMNKETLGQIARRVTWYFEDIVADLGIWRSFSEECKKLFGYDIPIFHEREEYFPDEPSLNAVRYIVWDTASELHRDITLFPDSKEMLEMSKGIYNILNSRFEDAPVNDDAKQDIKAIIEHSCKGFNELRESLAWILMGNYMTRNFDYFKDEADYTNLIHDDDLGNASASMKTYFVRTHNYFHYRTGALALYPVEWLAALARVNGMEKEQKALEDIKVLDTDAYQYKAKDDEWLHMEGAQGNEFDIRTTEFNLPKKALEANDGCIGEFIFFLGEWHLNGIFASRQYGDNFKALKDAAASNSETNTLGTERILKATDGKRLLFYKSTKDMVDDLKAKKIFPEDQKFPFENNPDCEMPCLFVNEDDPTNNLFFGFNFEEYIKDPSNPYYNEEEAKKDAITMLWEPNAPSEFTEYLINHDLLPDVAKSRLFLKDSSDKDKKEDMLFMVRYTRRHNY